MKKLMTLICALFCMAQVYAANPVKQWGQLQVKGAQLCDQSGNPVVLRGVSLGWHNIWPRFYNKNAVKWLVQDWHANIIRAAMGIQIDDNYLENPDFALKCITQVVDAAIKNDTYVIIDTRCIQPRLRPSSERWRRSMVNILMCFTNSTMNLLRINGKT